MMKIKMYASLVIIVLYINLFIEKKKKIINEI